MGSVGDKIMVAFLIIVILTHISSSEKSFLTDYEPIPGHEVEGVAPSTVIVGSDAETCARNCSTESRFQCLHFQHRPDEVNPPGICRIFNFQGRHYTEASGTWTIYTKYPAAFAGLPESGASSLIRGPALRLLIMMVMFAAVALILI